MTMSTTTSSVFKNSAFRRLCGALFMAMTASYALYFASITLVEEITHSSAQMGLMIFCSTLPGFLFGLIAGVVVDRHERIGVLMTSNVLRALVALSFLVAVHFLPPLLLLPAIYLCNFSLAALTQFVAAAEGATVPRLVSAEQIVRANSLFSVSLLAAQGAGLVVLAPLLLKLGGAQAVGLAAVLLNLAATALSATLPRERTSACESRSLSGLWADFKAGWHFIVSDRLTSLVTAQLVLVSSVSLVLSTLAPGFVARDLGLRLEDAIYLVVPVGVGFGLGLVLVGRRKSLHRRERWVNIGLSILGLTLVPLAAMRQAEGTWLLLFLPVAVGLGLGFSLVMIPARAILQEHPPAAMRGRVVAAQLTLANAANTLPLLLAGGLADLIGIRRVLILVALTVLGAAVVSIRHSQA